MNNRKQLTVFFVMLIAYAFCIFVSYAFFTDQIAASAGAPMSEMPASNAVMGLASAGIGEEIMFRGFVFGLWGLLLNWLLKRFNGRTAALWIANIIAALAFGAGHLPALFFLADTTSFASLNPILLVEVFHVIRGLI